MGVLWTKAWCGQVVACHERMGREVVVDLRGVDPVEELLACLVHLSDRVEQKPSGAMCTGWYRQLVADEEVQAVVGTEAVAEHVLVVVGEDGSVHSLAAVMVEAAHFTLD